MMNAKTLKIKYNELATTKSYPDMIGYAHIQDILKNLDCLTIGALQEKAATMLEKQQAWAPDGKLVEIFQGFVNDVAAYKAWHLDCD
jgi:hypothetical protein